MPVKAAFTKHYNSQETDYRILDNRLCDRKTCTAQVTGIDRFWQPHYIGAMTKKTTPLESEVARLEEQVGSLLELLNRLTKENRSLRVQQELLATERAGLLEKHDQVRNRVDAIVTRLKSLETGT
jgi:cell division protein ZapB